MIAGATRGAGGPALAIHLLKRKGGQQVHVFPARYLASENLADQIAEIVAAGAHGHTDKRVYHVHIDPPEDCDFRAVINSFVTYFEEEFDLRECARAGVIHKKNGRLHAHFVYSPIKPDGKMINLSHEYARREKLCRITEFRHGLELIKKESIIVPSTMSCLKKVGMTSQMR